MSKHLEPSLNDILVYNCPKMSNGSDCGIYLIEYLYVILNVRILFYLSSNIFYNKFQHIDTKTHPLRFESMSSERMSSRRKFWRDKFSGLAKSKKNLEEENTRIIVRDTDSIEIQIIETPFNIADLAPACLAQMHKVNNQNHVNIGKTGISVGHAATEADEHTQSNPFLLLPMHTRKKIKSKQWTTPFKLHIIEI